MTNICDQSNNINKAGRYAYSPKIKFNPILNPQSSEHKPRPYFAMLPINKMFK